MTTPLFDPAALQHVVATTLADSPDVPVGARGAFLTVANNEGVKAVIAVRVADGWQVKAVVSHGWASTQVDYGVSVTGTW